MDGFSGGRLLIEAPTRPGAKPLAQKLEWVARGFKVQLFIDQFWRDIK
jgi:hypothetical protein